MWLSLLVGLPRGGHTAMPPGNPLGTGPLRMGASMFSCLTSVGQGTFLLPASPPPAPPSGPPMGFESMDMAL